MLLQWPAYAPEVSEFRWALTTRLREEDTFLQRLDPPSCEPPLAWLARTFDLPEQCDLNRLNLLQHTEFGGRPYWVDAPAAAVDNWLEFAARLAVDTNNLAVFERALLVVPFPPDATPPAQDAGIAVIRWDDHYDDLDALTLASTLLRSRYSGVTRALLASMAAQIALFDVPFLRALVEQERDTQLAPEAFLRAEAARRGWEDPGEPSESAGMVAQFGGQRRLHSLIKVQQGGVSRRIWRAQASVLLLQLEEARQHYIARYVSELTLPFNTEFARVTNRQDLELSHLTYQARNYFRSKAAQDLPRLEALTQARHSLAHLNDLPLEAVRQLLES